MNNIYIFYFLTGIITASIIFLLFIITFAILGYEFGFSNLLNKFAIAIFPVNYKEALCLSEETLKELVKIKAIIGKAGNPTNQPRNNTILVRPDPELGFCFRPNIKISGHILKFKSIRGNMLNPPVLYLRTDSLISDNLKNYIKEYSRLSFSYSTDENAFRRVIPAIEADKKVLIVGDSVGFGYGVDDEYTIASYLQRMLGNHYKVVNACVGGYDGYQSFLMAKRESLKNKYSCLIYIACQDDFEDKGYVNKEKITTILRQIRSLSDKFQGNIIIILHTHMEYCLRDILSANGWRKKKVESTDLLLCYSTKTCNELGLVYYDWTDIVRGFTEENKSIFSRFALYVDHCHFSSLGNKLVSERLFNALSKINLLKKE